MDRASATARPQRAPRGQILNGALESWARTVAGSCALELALRFPMRGWGQGTMIALGARMIVRRRSLGSLLAGCLALLAAGCSGVLVAAGEDGGAPPARDGGAPADASPPPTVDASQLADAAMVPRCEPDDSSALVLDGVDDHIALGRVPALGLAQLTIEAWVRRDGAGRETGTGVNGISVVPIVAKGRGESDGSNVDTNYAFGFVGDVIGADFEDMASGANHPIVGRTAIRMGEWHHVAVTYDGAAWALYVDGRVDRRRTVDARPRADSIQPVGIGAAFNSSGARAGALEGALDHVRIWDHARTAAQIAAGLYAPPASVDGLVLSYSIDASEGATVLDDTGSHDGTIADPVYTSPGAPVGRGAPPVPALAAPADDAIVDGPSVEAEVHVTDDGGDPVTVTYYARPITDDADFTIVVLPDTQNYTRNGNERFFYGQTQWIMDNADAYNIVAVLHNGDMINNWDVVSQWRVADRAMATLETETPALPDGMPTGISIGNHDIRGGVEVFNRWFGLDRYEHRAYYGGHYRAGNNDSFITFSAGGLDFVAVNLKWDEEPSPEVHAWARQVFESHPESFGILNTHYLLRSDGEFGPQGRRIYESLKDVQNLHLMTSGHISTERRRSDTSEATGHRIVTMLADYQARENGGGGMMRIWEFSPANDELTVRSYSPTQDRWETDANSQFTLRVDLSGAGEPLTRVGEVEADGGRATLALTELAPGTLYEWYATASDCSHVARTEVRRFTTRP